MTSETEFLIYCLIILSAVYFTAWSYWLNRRKREPAPPPEIAFRWPDRIEMQYLDKAGNVVTSRFYLPE